MKSECARSFRRTGPRIRGQRRATAEMSARGHSIYLSERPRWNSTAGVISVRIDLPVLKLAPSGSDKPHRLRRSSTLRLNSGPNRFITFSSTRRRGRIGSVDAKMNMSQSRAV